MIYEQPSAHQQATEYGHRRQQCHPSDEVTPIVAVRPGVSVHREVFPYLHLGAVVLHLEPPCRLLPGPMGIAMEACTLRRWILSIHSNNLFPKISRFNLEKVQSFLRACTLWGNFAHYTVTQDEIQYNFYPFQLPMAMAHSTSTVKAVSQWGLVFDVEVAAAADDDDDRLCVSDTRP